MTVLTLGEAAELLQVSPRTLRREIKAGNLTTARIGRCVRIIDTDLAAWLEASRTLRPDSAVPARVVPPA